MNKKLLTAIVFHNLRILHGVTPQDTYLDNYKAHLEKAGEEFFDIHCLAVQWATDHHPKKIMEIGSRTGLSLAQLLSPYQDFTDMRIVLFDVWNDGLSNPELIKKHLKHLAIPTDSIEFYKGDSKETVPEFKKTNKDKFDWILVDGGHDFPTATQDLNNVVDLVAQEGVIVFDDVTPQPDFSDNSMLPVWTEFKKNHYNEFSWNEDTNGKGTCWAIKL
jgi:predicted O-methyltransferase YrrM